MYGSQIISLVEDQVLAVAVWSFIQARIFPTLPEREQNLLLLLLLLILVGVLYMCFTYTKHLTDQMKSTLEKMLFIFFSSLLWVDLLYTALLTLFPEF